ncbi:MarR family winged helix-turn-helix transcriptional regulator [Rhodococcus kronopolitis]|uniref:MarR family winged helix-turn-helix transcriptional regulator n=1 Tax=Rhodococcus kronopolitis TaxID=1460226 RepID=A0ABV9FUT8_9NOCA
MTGRRAAGRLGVDRPGQQGESTAGAAAALALVHRLRALAADLDQLGAVFAERNALHATDLRALVVLLDADRAKLPATPGWLAAQLGLGSAATTALLDRLERAGHLVRAADPGDRRRVLLRVQEQARYLGWSYFAPLVGRVDSAMTDFDADERATVDRFLCAIGAAVAAEPDRAERRVGRGDRLAQ